MNICLITCFHGRHYQVERILRCFLNQDYTGNLHLLLYNNSPTPQTLDEFPIQEGRHIRLINNHLDLQTNKEYTNTGSIFRDALTFLDPTINVISFFDSDDIFLPNHASEGAKRMKVAYKYDAFAYKPYFSYYLYGDNKIEKVHNTMEPSIFVDRKYVETVGFNMVASSYHQKWLDPLYASQQLYVPFWGVPTLLYDWHDGHNTHKISGLGDHSDNFIAHRKYETEYGDGILSPCDRKIVDKYYDLVKNQ